MLVYLKALNKLKKTAWGKVILFVIIFLLLLIVFVLLTILLLFVSVMGTMFGLFGLDKEAENVDIYYAIPEEMLELYYEVQDEFKVSWMLMASIHAIQTEFAEGPQDGFFGFLRLKTTYNDAFDLSDRFWDSYQESKERYWCLKDCEEKYDKCNERCRCSNSNPGCDLSGCYASCRASYDACCKECMKILPERDKLEDIIYTVAMFLEGVDMENDKELDDKLYSIAQSHEKRERIKLLYWLYAKRYGGGEGWPLPPEYTYISSHFGWRVHPIEGIPRYHNGIDIPAPFGTPIYAFRAGVVTFADFVTNSYGSLIIIDHGDGLESRYAHMQAILVSAGETVEVGQQIAEVGSEGGSTGAHLHFEIRENGEVVDPMPYLSVPSAEEVVD